MSGARTIQEDFNLVRHRYLSSYDDKLHSTQGSAPNKQIRTILNQWSWNWMWNLSLTTRECIDFFHHVTTYLRTRQPVAVMFQKLIRTLIFCFIWVNGEIQTFLTSPKFNHRHKYPKWIEYWSNRLTVIVNWYRNMAHCLQFWGDRSNVEPSTTLHQLYQPSLYQSIQVVLQ